LSLLCVCLRSAEENERRERERRRERIRVLRQEYERMLEQVCFFFSSLFSFAVHQYGVIVCLTLLCAVCLPLQRRREKEEARMRMLAERIEEHVRRFSTMAAARRTSFAVVPKSARDLPHTTESTQE
jgi:hypothetical protein